MCEDDSAPGWEAIDLALKPIYGDQEPLHWAPTPHYAVGGSVPLDGISAYRRTEHRPHWHFITYGLSELYAKDSPDTELSGYGFELTFRVAADPSEETPPSWVFGLLQNLARYVFSTGNAFAAGHYMHLNGPIALGIDTKLWAIVLVADPELPAMDTPHGRLQFLQVVGITLDECAAIKAWNAASFLELLKPQLPLFLTDPGRPSLTDDLEVAEAVHAGTQKDGSSTDSLFIGAANWRIITDRPGHDRLVLTLGANGVPDLKAVLPGRLPHGRELLIASHEQAIVVVPSDHCSWAVEEQDSINLHLTPAAAVELASVIVPKQGTFSLEVFPDLSVRVVPSAIKDADGNVVDVIG